jgi:hypothetical protein
MAMYRVCGAMYQILDVYRRAWAGRCSVCCNGSLALGVAHLDGLGETDSGDDFEH